MSDDPEEKMRNIQQQIDNPETVEEWEQTIPLRVKQLALSKVLVNIHGRDGLVAVVAHTDLGECYLRAKYLDQAIEHLTTALTLNGTLFSTVAGTKPYHAHVLKLLGQCYIETDSASEAITLLEKALKLNVLLKGEEDISNAEIHLALSEACMKLENWDGALSHLTAVWELKEAAFGMRHKETADVMAKMAFVNAKKEMYDQAIDLLKRSLGVYKALENCRDLCAHTAVTLSEWHEQKQDIISAIEALREAEDIYKSAYGVSDKRTIRVKRDIALLQLQRGDYEDALWELKEVEELEKDVFGPTSTHVAKTLKAVGTVYIIQQKYEEAVGCLEQALSICKEQNNKTLAKDVKKKLDLAKTQAGL
eukprot:GILK01002302.1.p1 GENE.GILK01002302.1~~GILK01002302.1.p1  ORF type:complete len:383 (+),score=65.37 GILK01002302.1:58-1149(+)